jgi:hypothetical protein
MFENESAMNIPRSKWMTPKNILKHEVARTEWLSANNFGRTSISTAEKEMACDSTKMSVEF